MLCRHCSKLGAGHCIKGIGMISIEMVALTSLFCFILMHILFLFFFKKWKKICLIALIILVPCYLISMMWLLSCNAIAHIQPPPQNLSLTERYHLTRDALATRNFFALYDPCDYNGLDGPVTTSGNHSDTRLFPYHNAALVVTHDVPYHIETLLKTEQPEYFFSLSNAAYHLQKILGDSSGHREGEIWMVQFVEVQKIFEEISFVFVMGKGVLSMQCPHFFKINTRAAISITGKIYRLDDGTPKYLSDMPKTDIDSISPKQNYGINVLSLTNLL